MTDEAIASLGDEGESFGPTVISSKLLSAARLIIWAIATLIFVPIQLMALGLGLRFAERFPPFYERQMLKVFGVKVVIRGQPIHYQPTLFVSNHTSYFDIVVLGAFVPARFVSKAEIAHWPVFGLLARLQKTVFIERKRTQAGGQKNQLTDLLNSGVNLILFPEGTTNDGIRTLPFKSSLFGVVGDETKGLKIQPISLDYSHLDGLPIGRHLKPFVAWFGDIDLFTHLPRAFGLGQIQATLTFHDPIDTAGRDRKQLAEEAFKVVQSGIKNNESLKEVLR